MGDFLLFMGENLLDKGDTAAVKGENTSFMGGQICVWAISLEFKRNNKPLGDCSLCMCMGEKSFKERYPLSTNRVEGKAKNFSPLSVE